MSQQRKMTLDKNIIPRSCQDSNPRPFDHNSGALTTELSTFVFSSVLTRLDLMQTDKESKDARAVRSDKSRRKVSYIRRTPAGTGQEDFCYRYPLFHFNLQPIRKHFT